MRNFLTKSFVALALVVGAAAVVPTAHAQTQDQINAANELGTAAQQAAAGQGTAAQQAAAALPSSVYDPAAAGTSVPMPENPVSDSAYSSIMVWIMSLFAWLVGVAAITLDNAVYYTVVTMGNYVNHLSAIGVTWRILRDIGNILLIFGFLAVGITTILNVNWYGGGTKMLPMMLVAAIFLNFSLFISEALVDTGNLFATQFYQQINGGNPAGAKNFDLTSVSNEGISNKIMQQVGLQGIYGNGQVKTEIFKAGNTWTIGFMAIILFIITAFVMFSLAFILIARFVALVFLLVVAPIGFAGLAVPGFAKRANQWWTTLFEQIITAPILLLMLYIALAVITDASFLTGFCIPAAGSTNTACTPDWTGFATNNLTGFASMILSFLVAMGLLIAVVIYAKRWSAFGGDWASRMGAKLSFGLTAAGMRSTVGWASQGASQLVRRRMGGTKTGRVLAGALDRGATASFDLRGTGALKTIPFGSSIDAGAAQKGGYRARREAVIKGHQEYIKTVGEAIDEHGATKEEEARVAAAGVMRASAEKELAAATELHESAKARLTPQLEQQRAEVDRLKKIKEANDRNKITDPETARQLEDAQKKLATTESILAAASTNLAGAASSLKKATEEETATGKEAGERMKKEKLGAQMAYAGNISGSFPGWVMYGPGGSAAAKKIIKDAKKSPDQQLLDSLKKAIAAGEKKPEEKKEDAPKPEAAH